jgi:DNA (cytosine-5)-methyltransferase 1
MTVIENIAADPSEARFDAFWTAWLEGDRTWMPPISAPALRTVDLFGAAGGFGLGASLAASAFGRRAVFGAVVDVDGPATEVYARSLPVRRRIVESVAGLIDYRLAGRGEPRLSYPPEIVSPELAAEVGRTGLLIGGPPCQGHSNLNNHTRRDDPRNDLYVTSAAIGIALKAPAIVLENVPTVRQASGDVVDIAKTILRADGYGVSDVVLRWDALGGWQTRRRHMLVAVKDATDEAIATHLRDWESKAGHEPSRGRPARSVGFAMERMPRRSEDGTFDSSPTMGAANRVRVDALYERGLHDMPFDLRPECHRDGTSYEAVYGRMHEDRPSPTITTGIGTPGQGRFLHPIEPRLITPHEAARIQGFPDDHGFDGSMSRKSLAKWIGDAVPPMLGAIAVGTALSLVLDEPFDPPWDPDGR